ncbi:S-adenosylmethionine:tRNA ribosyltransferase-isomerase [Usitatibacter rugosus]|uniref:S-adenosylmethionine:tRNA ribosyltransferase-isomerase n=1 Tax=Usitatibacter rugosus TaxID=2732067 RepID=A0A6M4GS05_9PROT|nr:tRNA preQ1(34) S-adenosylmethionine ribosyltransferase-isomerase QueA [Usitatibacter rugosus]QJR09892.1 S-adenosylmethionine:tRNA ribosyltransferase-isomerase [Usitatibacter rugosus]
MRLADFDYDLPSELIAQHPAADRSASRLLHLDGRTGTLEDLAFHDFSRLVGPQDILVFNDTKVIKARLRGHKDTGGEVEVLVERVLDEHRALAHVRASKTPKAGRKLVLTGGIEAEVLGRKDDLYELRFEGGATVLDQLAAHGEVPLPPYITHKPDAADESRYQTVYAREPGAVAAPTAGLHFDTATLEGLKSRGIPLCHVTLHVGAGTFQPVRGDDVATHVMHSEWYSIPEATVTAIAKARANNGRVIAVGTTTLRALEARASEGPLRGGGSETRIFITPGFEFKVVDRLLTNFHLPKSTLLMLVSAFAGLDNVRAAYSHAVRERYRFFSYGDAMLLERG